MLPDSKSHLPEFQNALQDGQLEPTGEAASTGPGSQKISFVLDNPVSQLSWIKKSLLFAQLSRLSYANPEPVEKKAYEAGLDECIFVARDGAEAYILGNRTDCMVICRGTEPNQWNDIRADANAWTVSTAQAGAAFEREPKNSLVCRPFAWRSHGRRVCGPMQDFFDPFQSSGYFHLWCAAGWQQVLCICFEDQALPMGKQQRHCAACSAEMVGLSTHGPGDLSQPSRQNQLLESLVSGSRSISRTFGISSRWKAGLF